MTEAGRRGNGAGEPPWEQELAGGLTHAALFSEKVINPGEKSEKMSDKPIEN